MIGRLGGTAALVLLMGCGAADESAETAEPTADQATTQQIASTEIATSCQPQDRMAVDGRESPYDSTVVTLGDASATVCYGRPSMRGRQIFGGLVPYDTLWRTGANEPTIIHLPFPAEIAGIAVEPGSYSLYTVPGQNQWTVIVNRSIDQWGIESQYTEDVRAQEVGRAPVAAETISEAVETFTIASEPAGTNAANLVLEWENTRVTIPIQRTS